LTKQTVAPLRSQRSKNERKKMLAAPVGMREKKVAQGLAAIRGREWVAGGQDITVGTAKSFLQWPSSGGQALPWRAG